MLAWAERLGYPVAPFDFRVAGVTSISCDTRSTAATIREGIEGTAGLRVLGDPLRVIAFTSDEVNINDVLDRMTAHGWSLNAVPGLRRLHQVMW